MHEQDSDESDKTIKDVIQLKKKRKSHTIRHSVRGTDEDAEKRSFEVEDLAPTLTIKKLMEAVKDRVDYEEEFGGEERGCDDERSSQASDYFRKPSNVDISPPPESSETALNRQQEYFKHFKNIKLTEQQAECLTIILQDAFFEMIIINNCNRQLLDDMATQARRQNLSKESPGRDGDKSQDLQNMGNDSLKLAKMESDKNYLMNVLLKFYLDLKINKSFPSLLVHLSDLSAKSYQSIAREIHYRELKSMLRKLQSKLVNDTDGHKDKLLLRDKEIYKLKDDIDDSTWNSEIRIRYVDAWQNAQMEQHTLAIEKTEGGPLNTIRDTEDLMKKETRIHKEIMKYFKASMQDYTDQIETWMEKFDNEMDQLDMDIRVMKENRASQTDETDSLQNLFDEHKREMEDWQAVLDERARLKALEELMLISAIKIQSWWRGCLARKLLKKLLKKKRKMEKKAAKGKGRGKK